MLAKRPKGATEKKRGSGLASLLWMFVGAILTLMIGLFLYLWNPFDMNGQIATPEQSTVKPINQQNAESLEGADYKFYELLPEQEITNIPDEAIVREEPLDEQEEVTLNPDVVIDVPEEDNTLQGENAPIEPIDSDTQEYGISEDTVQNPMQSQAPQAVEGDGQIAIVEEEGTYDEPVEGETTNQTTADNTTTRNTETDRQDNVNDSITSPQAVTPTTYILQINSFASAEEADRRRAQVLMAGVDAQVVKNERPDGTVLYQVISSTMTNRQKVIMAQKKLQNNGIDSLIVEQRR